MKKRILELGLVAVLCGATAEVAPAQALATASGPGSYASVGGGYSWMKSDYGNRLLGGAFIFADVHPHWRYGFEGEVRYLRVHSDLGVTQTTYLGGAQVYLRPGSLRPYAKVLAGLGHLNFPFSYGTGSYLVIATGAGVEVGLDDRVSIRMLDFEYQQWPQFTYGSLHPYGFSAGVNYRLNRVRRFPK